MAAAHHTTAHKKASAVVSRNKAPVRTRRRHQPEWPVSLTTLAIVGLSLAALACSAYFVPRPLLRRAGRVVGDNLQPTLDRIVLTASQLTKQADALGRSLRG